MGGLFDVFLRSMAGFKSRADSVVTMLLSIIFLEFVIMALYRLGLYLRYTRDSQSVSACLGLSKPDAHETS